MNEAWSDRDGNGVAVGVADHAHCAAGAEAVVVSHRDAGAVSGKAGRDGGPDSGCGAVTRATRPVKSSGVVTVSCPCGPAPKTLG